MEESSAWRSRTRLLYGEEGAERIESGHVLVAGLGAVGSFAVEALARSGVGHLALVDFDVVEPSNANRQLYALHSTIGRPKTALAKARVLDINPACDVTVIPERLTEGNIAALAGRFRSDLVVDAIDDLRAKAALIVFCMESSVPVVSSMGAARRENPAALSYGSIGAVRGCPLAKNLRRLLRRSLEERGLPHDPVEVVPVERLCCIYSKELPLPSATDRLPSGSRASGSSACVTGAFGLLAASRAIEGLLSLQHAPAGNSPG